MLFEPTSWSTRFLRLNIHYLSIYTNKPLYPTCPLLIFEWSFRSTTCFKFMTQQQLLMTKKNAIEVHPFPSHRKINNKIFFKERAFLFLRRKISLKKKKCKDHKP